MDTLLTHCKIVSAEKIQKCTKLCLKQNGCILLYISEQDMCCQARTAWSLPLVFSDNEYGQGNINISTTLQNGLKFWCPQINEPQYVPPNKLATLSFVLRSFLFIHRVVGDLSVGHFPRKLM